MTTSDWLLCSCVGILIGGSFVLLGLLSMYLVMTGRLHDLVDRWSKAGDDHVEF